VSSEPAVHLVKGDDAVVRRDAVRDLVRRLVGDGDASLMVEEIGADQHGATSDGTPDLGALVTAAQTPPFLTERRVVVGRDLGDFSTADQVAPLVDYLGDPLATTVLVLEWETGRIPKTLADAVARAGGAQIDASPGKKLDKWVDTHLRDAGLHLDSKARARVVDWLGENASRLMSLIETLNGAFPAGTRLGPDDVEPYLGEEGGVPPWELTDAIDSGDIAAALHKLERVLTGGGRHPLAVMSILHGHYARMLRLDGAEIGGDQDAAAALGMRTLTFPARKALTQVRRLGHDKVVRAIELLAQADLDLRGTKAWPDDLVMEVLVARLARLARA
jgi:DNA polymerase-3 subunit delta